MVVDYRSHGMQAAKAVEYHGCGLANITKASLLLACLLYFLFAGFEVAVCQAVRGPCGDAYMTSNCGWRLLAEQNPEVQLAKN